MNESGYPLCKLSSYQDEPSGKGLDDMANKFNLAFLLTSTLGLIFTALSILVLMAQKQLSSYNFLLVSLCAADSVQLLYHWIFFGLPFFNLDFEEGWPKFHRTATFMAYVGK